MRKFFVTMAAELVAALVRHDAGHFAPGREPKIPTFCLTGGDNMMPVVLKIRGTEKPQDGDVFRIIVQFDKARPFMDGNGKPCRSRDRWRFYCYLHDDPCAPTHGEMRFFRFPKGQQPDIFPLPIFTKMFEGVKENGCLWIASPETDYDVRIAGTADKILFSGNVVVQVNGPERAMPGSIRIEANDSLTVYDRREDRLSSFARAEHARRTVGEGRNARAYEFVNLRDASSADLANNPPTHVLTNAGFERIEEANGHAA